MRIGEEKDFLAVEVKGIKDRTGSLSFTPKEHEVATNLKDRFFLFVVRNFQELHFMKSSKIRWQAGFDSGRLRE